MGNRLSVAKTYKLFIGGKFPRSESGRTLAVADASGATVAHVCHASRKDLRDAVEAAQGAQPAWADAAAYLRGQILYRMAEMLEGRAHEMAQAIALAGAEGSEMDAAEQVARAVDRLVAWAGWADKHQQVLGCGNPVAGPFYNFTIPEPTGVIAVVCPDTPSLLGLVSLLAPVVCAGNAAVVIGSRANPIVPAVFAEVCATSDVPAGVINILTGDGAELAPVIASHRGIDGVHGANLGAETRRTLEAGAAENLKRVSIRTVADGAWADAGVCESPWWLESFVEMKTVWHPSSAG